MARRQNGKRTRVNHAQTTDAEDSSFIVNDRRGIVLGAHLAGTRGMEYRNEGILDELEDLLVRLHLVAREILPAAYCGSHGVALPELAKSLDRGNSDLLVCFATQPVGVDNR